MPGAGTHLHRLIKKFTGQDYSPSCSCRETVADMDKNPPQWSLDNIDKILRKLRVEASQRGWWKYLVQIPGASKPIRWLVKEAVRRAKEDEAKNG